MVKSDIPMQTAKIVLDKELLQAVDRAARLAKRSRSALVRDALREHLRRLEVRAMEEREREAYRRQPQDVEEVRLWMGEAAWPDK
jgi:metal-responsive CopG/Arc/MetJ family transcriptional regulator